MAVRRLHHTSVSLHLLVAMVLVLTTAVISTAPVRAGTTITVTEMIDEFNELSNNSGDCSVREAIVAANEDRAIGGCPAGSGADTIIVPVGTYTLAIDGVEGRGIADDLNITEDVTLRGAGIGKTIIDGDGRFVIKSLHSNDGNDYPAVMIDGMTLQHAYGGGDAGGGAINNSLGSLLIRRVLIRDSEAAQGAAINNSGTLVVQSSIITGNHARYDGGGIYHNEGDGSLQILGTSIRGNSAVFTGGGLYVQNGDAVMRNSTISGNTARDGGGIYVYVAGSLRARNTTISGNHADASGGGIRNGTRVQSGDYFGTVALANVTVSNNSTDGDDSDAPLTFVVGGGGLAGPATLRNTIIAGNTDASSRGDDCVLMQTSEGHNLIGDTNGCAITGSAIGNQLLGPLADNGGPTRTHALLDGSPAIDRGNPNTPDGGGWRCTASDQRGTTRPQDGDGLFHARCDIGAYERQANHS